MKKKGWQVVEHKSGHDERKREKRRAGHICRVRARARIGTDRQENIVLHGVTGGSRSRDGRRFCTGSSSSRASYIARRADGRFARLFVRSFTFSLSPSTARGLFRSLASSLLHLAPSRSRCTSSREPHDSPSGAAPPVIASFE